VVPSIPAIAGKMELMECMKGRGNQLRIVRVKRDIMKRKATIFWIFGVLQAVVLGSIIFLVFKSLNSISTVKVIGLDTQILLSILFPLFLLIVEYLIYSKE